MLILISFFLMSCFSLKAMDDNENELLLFSETLQEYYGSVVREDSASLFIQARRIHKELEGHHNEKLFYKSYKNFIKKIKSDEGFLEINTSLNPLKGVTELISSFPPKGDLCGIRSLCDVPNTKALNVLVIEKNLNEYVETSKKLLKYFPVDQMALKDDCIIIRRDILHFCALRVKKYHQERISYGDAIIPVICASCGTVDCALSAFACSMGHSLPAITCFVTGLMEYLTSAVCVLSLYQDNEPRCQQVCMNSDDFNALLSIKELLKKADRDHKELCN